MSSFADRAVTFAEDLVRTLTGHAAQVAARQAAVEAQLDLHEAAASAPARVEALQAAARALFGEEFRLLSEFALAPAQADEWANALAASGSLVLLDHLTSTLKIDFPVDEWLYGAARVRPQLHEWETTVMLTGAFGLTEPALVPIQLPHQDGAPWVAMQFRPGYVLDGDRLLYTAHYSTPFDGTAHQCGLLLDEWTEVVPSTTHTTGSGRWGSSAAATPAPRVREAADRHHAADEVPRAGTRLTQLYQRTRCTDGRVCTWLRVRRQTGRGEASSGLAFDELA